MGSCMHSVMTWNLVQQLSTMSAMFAAAALVLLTVHVFRTTAFMQSYQEACHEAAESPEFCINMLSPFGLEEKDVAKGTPGRFQLVSSALKSVLDGVNEELQVSERLGGALVPSAGQTLVTTKEKKNALNDCVEMLMRASELVGDSINTPLGNDTSSSSVADVHTWMSSALTYQTTCLDGLSQFPPNKEAIAEMMQEGGKVSARISTALSFIVTLYTGFQVDGTVGTDWVAELAKKPKPRKKAVSANVVVAKDGSGKYSNIQDAVDAAPGGSGSTYVIYIKAGVYKEKVSVSKSKANLMFVGDGIGKTVITGSKSVGDGATTFKTATVEINGRGFLGQDLTIQNTAGPGKHQAVALRVSADKVAFYRCSFEGYQDTLYTHVSRQFYRECTIYGTVDFIFGNAAAVFQGCSLIARLPMSKQKNTLTAQGRTDPKQNTGLSFQDCSIDGTGDLKSSGTPTFLGRPWKQYSLTVFLRCYEGSVIAPAGWLEWSGNFALKTLFYAEYQCKGPGFKGGSRVGWSSQMSSSSEASKYTPGSFVSGGDWLGGTNFPYSLGL